MAKSTKSFSWSDSAPEVLRLLVMMYVKYAPSARNVEDLLAAVPTTGSRTHICPFADENGPC